MRLTFSIPDPIARRFLAAVPRRQRSAVVARLLEEELASVLAALAEILGMA